LALYISFFPQLIAGPIVKYKDINKQLHDRTYTLEKAGWGIRKFIYGLGKKVIISNTLAKCVDTVYGLEYTELTGFLAWIAAILYTLQIYYDFSGYSDMATGLGQLFGFEFQENFNLPYISRSIQEFWQRWHISLGTWFKEYLYIPLGGNKRGMARTYINLLVVFFLTGLWHGASFNFILWGLYHGFFQIVERFGLKKFLGKNKVLSHLYVSVIVIFGWVLFRAEGLRQAGVMAKRMLLPWKYTESSLVVQDVLGNRTVFVIIIALAGCGLLQCVFKKTRLESKLKNSYFDIIYCASVLVLCIAMLASNTYNPFIYFRF
ncbi:MAG: MBOAT family protein, partial [Lachnospiraceae bacterium]|nr:MBOAT family protein [Lachnospiraceae bacterium]